MMFLFLLIFGVLGALAFGALAAVGIVIRAVLWLLFLPFRLLGLLITLPFFLVGAVIFVVGGLLLAVMGVVLASVMAALAVPAVPIALLIFLVWALTRASRRPAAV
jgi:hypothetical protein